MKIMMQFHAMPEEIVDYVKATSAKLNLAMTLMSFRPFALREITGELSVDDFLLDDADICMMLTHGKPNLSVNSAQQFYQLNPGAMSLNIGRLSEKGLQESGLSFVSQDQDKIAIAKAVAATLKQITKAGVVAVNPRSGAEAQFCAHRYTDGAKIEYEQGIKI